jgi:hypothetical protein
MYRLWKNVGTAAFAASGQLFFDTDSRSIPTKLGEECLMERKPIEVPRISRQSADAKKAYEAPTLLHWGNLRDMTQAVGNSGGKDRGRRKGQKRTR